MADATFPARGRMGSADLGSLIREYTRMGDLPVAVIEGGQIYLVRTDHIGRPVFATNDGGDGGLGGVLPALRRRPRRGRRHRPALPGQWFQAESGLHQNWMRDYDPTTGRYLEPDPLGMSRSAEYIDQCGCTTADIVDTYHRIAFVRNGLSTRWYGGEKIPNGWPGNPVLATSR